MYQESVDIGMFSFKLYESIFDKFCTAEMGILDDKTYPITIVSVTRVCSYILKQKERQSGCR